MVKLTEEVSCDVCKQLRNPGETFLHLYREGDGVDDKHEVGDYSPDSGDAHACSLKHAISILENWLKEDIDGQTI